MPSDFATSILLLRTLVKAVEEYHGECREFTTITPGHGNCCTCQACGYSHDDCRCTRNEFSKVIIPARDFLEKLGAI